MTAHGETERERLARLLAEYTYKRALGWSCPDAMTPAERIRWRTRFLPRAQAAKLWLLPKPRPLPPNVVRWPGRRTKVDR
jgi:hypothetical protein